MVRRVCSIYRSQRINDMTQSYDLFLAIYKTTLCTGHPIHVIYSMVQYRSFEMMVPNKGSRISINGLSIHGSVARVVGRLRGSQQVLAGRGLNEYSSSSASKFLVILPEDCRNERVCSTLDFNTAFTSVVTPTVTMYLYVLSCALKVL